MNLQNAPVRIRVEGVTPLWDAGVPDPVDGGAEGALREVLEDFESRPYCHSAYAWVSREDGDDGRVLMFRRPGRKVHVVGASDLAERLRELLGDGFVGWALHPVPATRTLLKVAEPTLGHRVHNMLSREGFITIEEVAATPDEALLDLRNLGTKSLNAIHAAVAAYADSSIAQLSGADEQASRREHIDTMLSPAHRVRNAQFVESLARSSVALEAVDAIVASLQTEPVPPVDPMVTLLLRTAGEPELSALYERAHQPPS